MGVLTGLVAGMVGAGIGAIAMRHQRQAERAADGWRILRPSGMMHFALVGSLVFVCIVAVFFADGGSGRRDAAEQNFYAFLFGAFFFACLVYTLWAGYLRVASWRGNVLRIRSPLGEKRFDFRDIVDMSSNSDGSVAKLRLKDGRVVPINMYSHGAFELLEAIENAHGRPVSRSHRRERGRKTH